MTSQPAKSPATESATAKEAPAVAGDKPKFTAERVLAFWKSYGIFLILAVIFAGLALASPQFLSPTNLFNVGGQVSVLGLISLGVLLTIVTGNVDLTVGALVGFTGAVIALVGLHVNAVAALLAGVAAGVVVGLLNGFLSTRGRNLSVIVTLAVMTALAGTTLLITNGQPVYGFPSALTWLGFSTVAGIPVSLVTLVTVAAFLAWFLSRTRWGRELYAVGGNAEAARLAGIPVVRRVQLAFLMSALLAALAGLILIGRVASAQPTGGIGMELMAVGAVLIGGASLNGGAGRVANTLAGVLILGLVTNGINLLNINGFFGQVVTGVVILIAILMNQWERGDVRRA